ncbi:MAG: hypothetical protein Q9209_004672 [Squamulea sp. 1 TL-2023]
MASSGKVFVAGFNLHGQLGPGASGTDGCLDHFMQMQNFEDVDLREDRVVGSALWSATIINTGKQFVHNGISGTNPNRVNCDRLIDRDGKPMLGLFFGDVSGVRGFLDTKSGDFYVLQDDSKNDAGFVRHAFESNSFLQRTGQKITGVAIAGNLQVCITTSRNDPSTFVYSNLESLLEGSDPVQIHTSYEIVKTLVASSTTFATLGQRHSCVKTFGDARYPTLLGRTPSAESPTSLPTVISALDGINIAKIAAGPWLIAAVSSDNDLYVWGHVMRQPIGNDYSNFDRLLNSDGQNRTPEDVHLVDIADGHDVDDVAVGNEHLVVRITTGEVWGYGSNEYAQLGLGREVKSTDGAWFKIFTPDEGERIWEIAAGPLNTLVVVCKP